VEVRVEREGNAVGAVAGENGGSSTNLSRIGLGELPDKKGKKESTVVREPSHER
jgi:ABC-type Mn2+/Zn2+ transport system ATPase subunit